LLHILDNLSIDSHATSATMPKLSYAGYGKDNVRVLKVQKEESGVHSVFEFTVQTILEGDIETS
jgi:urate oxidase